MSFRWSRRAEMVSPQSVQSVTVTEYSGTITETSKNNTEYSVFSARIPFFCPPSVTAEKKRNEMKRNDIDGMFLPDRVAR